jgi:hypothetical protein
MKAAGGASAIVHLEQKKRKLGVKTFGPSKRLKSRGDSEDAGDGEASTLAASPVTVVPPPSAVPQASASGSCRPPGLDVNDPEAESNDDDVDVLGSPVGDAECHDVVATEMVLSHRKASTNSSSSSSSSSFDGSERRVSSKEEGDWEEMWMEEEAKACPTIHVSTKTGSDADLSSPMESSNFFVSQDDPVLLLLILGLRRPSLSVARLWAVFTLKAGIKSVSSCPRMGRRSVFL